MARKPAIGTVNSEIFARVLFSQKELKVIFATLKNFLLLGHDLQVSVNDRVIAQNREDLIFTKFRENKNLAKISEFTVYYASTASSILAIENVAIRRQLYFCIIV